jgi:CpeT protein
MRVFGFVSVALFLSACGDSDSAGGGGSGGEAVGGTGGVGGSGGAGGAGGSAAEPAADKLLRFLTGHFDSTAQSVENPTYFAIDLLTCPIELPELGARTLHVEQAVIDNGVVGAPYRQRVYVVTEGADPATQAISQVWEFSSPDDFSGFCDGTGAQATAADLVERQGCQVELTWVEDHFEGSTPGKECLSDLNGATYATSEVKLYEDRIESWDRGYDAADMQVWGATAGAYRFDRLSPLPEP